MVETPPRGRLAVELDVDVCVIGGGLAGLTVALEVAKRGWSVAVLEARRIAWNASGRNAGFVLPGFPADPQALIDKVGQAHAKTLWAMSEAGADYVRRTIRETRCPVRNSTRSGWLHVSKFGNDRKIAGYAEIAGREFGAAAEFWPASAFARNCAAHAISAASICRGAFRSTRSTMRSGLAAAAEAAGARIFEETPALEIDPAGVRKRITTPLARRARRDTSCSPAMSISATLMPDLAGTLVPIWAYSIVTRAARRTAARCYQLPRRSDRQ